MATGIQTSVRSRRSGFAPQPQQPTGYVAKVFELWSKTSRRNRMIGIGLLIAGMLAVAGVQGNAHVNRFTDLYPIKMNTEDVRDVSMELTKAQIEHTVSPTNDSVLLHPKDKTRAQALLADAGLPQLKAAGRLDPNSVTTTRDMRIEQQRLDLENELSQTLRAMNGIREARVRIALPPRTFFMDKENPVKASIFLKLSPGHEISRSMAQGIGSLVAHSVPELQRENVSIHDSNGEKIVVEPAPESMHMKVQLERQRALQKELQDALEHIYGPRAYASVNLTLDFSHEEIRRYTPGSEADDGVVKDSSQIMIESLKGEKDERDYEERKEAVNWKVRENYYARLRQYAEVKRITATVLVDGADPSEVDGIKDLVRGSIGIDETRSDMVYVNTLPWDKPMDMGFGGVPPMGTVKTQPEQEEGPSPLQWAAMAGLFGLACGLSATFLTSRTRPLMSVEMGGSGVDAAHDIVDHHQSKDGHRVTRSDETTGGTRMEALEAMVVSQPSRSAALLKTWLD